MTRTLIATPAQAHEWLAQNKIRAVRVEWSDLNGLGRGKVVPAARFPLICREGIQFSNAALTFDIQSIPASAAGMGATTGYRNVRALPDLATLRTWPVDAEVAWCQCNIESLNGVPINASPRDFATRIGKQLAAQGLHARIAPELEFYIADSKGAALETGFPCYGTESLHRFEAALQSACSATAAFWPLEAWHHEHGPGQFEINVGHAPYQDAIDGLHGARIAIREAVARHGLRATFMAKPYNGLNGSACQLNLSLQNNSGENLFADQATPGVPSALCRQFIGGVLAHLDEIAAVLLPNGNSFRRVVPGHFAPITKAWGLDNRTAAVRAIAQTPASTRVELRVPGADINAYLAVPAFVAAGLDGIARKLDPGPAAEGDLDSGDHPRVVTDWGAALRLFEQSDWVRSVFGPELAGAFLSVKRQEFGRFSHWVSDFDASEYGQVL
jgi:glutamine synthetase